MLLADERRALLSRLHTSSQHRHQHPRGGAGLKLWAALPHPEYVAGGIAVTLSLSSLIRRLLFGIQPNDPLTLSSAVLAIWAIGMLGVLIPASQAAKVEPASALRSD